MARKGTRTGILAASVALWILSSLLIILVVGLRPTPLPPPAPPQGKYEPPTPERPAAPPPAPPVYRANPPRRSLPPASPGVKIRNRGSDTMIEIAQAWAEDYRDALIEVSGGGSGTGIAALIDGKLDICNSSRPMTEKEVEQAKKKTGKEPKLHVVGYDALAIYVHRDNPLLEITLEQLKDLFGDGGKISSWSQLRVKVPGCNSWSRNIVLVSRQNNSGTYEYFRERVLGKEGKFKLGTIDQSGSRDVVALVGKTPCAIGYSGMGYKTDAVKFLKVKGKDGQAVGPSISAVRDRTYPISRPLFMYTLGDASPAIEEYIDWVRSEAGQKILESIGYVPLPVEERSDF